MRPRDTTLVAVRAKSDCTIDVGGLGIPAREGDYVITRGAQAIRVLSPESFLREYEPIVPGQLTLSAAECAALEETLGLGATASIGKLLVAIERLAQIKVGDIRIPFTPGQLHELQHRAAKRGRTVEAEMRAVVSRIEDELFYGGAAGARTGG